MTTAEHAAALLAPTGVLRASINVGNPVLARHDGSGQAPYGVSIDMARALASPGSCRIKVFSKKQEGASRGRNLGIRNADGEIILFIDDDTFPDPSLLREHLAVHETDPRCVVLGWVNHI